MYVDINFQWISTMDRQAILFPAASKQRTVESAARVNIHTVMRVIRQSKHQACSILWNIGSLQEAGVVALKGDFLCVQIRAKTFYAAIVYRKPHFGGITPSLVCGSCAREVNDLYVGDDRLQCRRCSGLRYQSQLERAVGRAQLKAMKAASKLDTNPATLERLPMRKKGQWGRTYRKLIAKLISAQQAYYAGLGGLVAEMKVKQSG